MKEELKYVDDGILLGPGTVCPQTMLEIRTDAEPCKLSNSGKLCFTGEPASDAKLEVSTIQNVGIGSGAVGVTQPASYLEVYSATGNVGIGSGFKGVEFKPEKNMTIEMGGKYIRRCDRKPDGQPMDGVVPVTILTTTLTNGKVCYQYMGDVYKVGFDGRSVDTPKFDLFPWPEPPKLVPWDCLEDIPLDAWFKRTGTRLSCRIDKADPVRNVPGDLCPISLSGGWVSFETLFRELVWSYSPMGPWEQCGKVAT